MSKSVPFAATLFVIATVVISAQAQEKPPALGVPPDGLYSCGKISGSMYMTLGELTLDQGRYEGFGSVGDLGIYPDDTLSFMDGLSLFPEITDVRYYQSTTGAGVLAIYYQTPSGWSESMDCYLE